MARPKKDTKTTKKTTQPVKATKPTKRTLSKNELVNQDSPKPNLQQLKLSESYISLALGAGVVAIIAMAFFIFLKGSSSINETNDTAKATPSISVSPTPEVQAGQTTHVMEENQSLWDVAVRYYGDGYKWPQIVEANAGVIENSDFVPPGTKIIIPEAK